jgi:hypothetical protein
MSAPMLIVVVADVSLNDMELSPEELSPEALALLYASGFIR